ncbi:MAG: alpha/beta hydrolase [Anaerolineae bacterium]
MKLEILAQHPGATAQPTPLLFVHGAWHGAWCWAETFLPYCAEHGYHSYAVSLRGHGGSLNEHSMRFTSVWDYVMDVARAAAQIKQETGARPVVVGHSMGGYVVQKYLEEHTAPAAVLLASIPVIGTLPFTLRMVANYPLVMLRTLLEMRAYPMVGTPQLAQQLFFSESLPEETVRAYHRHMVDESLRIVAEAAFLERIQPKKMNIAPILVLAALNDQVFTTEEENATAQAYGIKAEFFKMAHDMMLEPGWQQVADRIIDWLHDIGL